MVDCLNLKNTQRAEKIREKGILKPGFLDSLDAHG
jgi:hypothetical protein